MSVAKAIHDHSLSIVTSAVLATWVVAYVISDPGTHYGSFFGNAIADWTGLLTTVLGTKYFYEIGYTNNKRPKGHSRFSFLRNHSLAVFLVATGIFWVAIFLRMNPDSKWGQVVSNLVSEWTQTLGLLLMSKELFEKGSKDGKKD